MLLVHTHTKQNFPLVSHPKTYYQHYKTAVNMYGAFEHKLHLMHAQSRTQLLESIVNSSHKVPVPYFINSGITALISVLQLVGQMRLTAFVLLKNKPPMDLRNGYLNPGTRQTRRQTPCRRV